MLTAFKSIPVPLQKQTLIRLGFSAIFLFLMFALILFGGEPLVWFPCVCAAVFFCLSGFALFRCAVLGRYVIVSGVCSNVGLTAVKRRKKYFLLTAEGRTIRVALRGQNKRIIVGMTVCLYVAENTPLYEKGGVLTILSYLALEINEKCTTPVA